MPNILHKLNYYYKCVGKTKHKNGCKNPSLNKDWLESKVLKAVIDVVMDENNVKQIAQASYDEILSTITDEDLKTLYLDYIKMRKLIKAPMTDRALQMLIKKVNELEPDSIDNQKKLLETAIMNNWKSVYPLRKGETNVSTNNKRCGDEYAFLG